MASSFFNPPASTAPSTASLRHLAAPGLGSLVQGGAALFWLPQAALLAWAVQGLGAGAGIDAVLLPAFGIVVLGALRAACEAWGARRIFGEVRGQLSMLRGQLAAALAARSPLDMARPASGQAASVIAEQAEAVLPYLVRYQPARWRAMLVPIFILVAVAWFSWVVALILLVAAPLIPLFMAIVGWRAQAASQQQMVEMGAMNAFLLDRLRGLATLRALGAVDATAHRLGDVAQSLRHRTMAVLRIAFLSSAVLELFAALGVAMVAVYIGFHLLGTLAFGSWGHRLSLGEGLFVLLLAPAFFEPLRELSAVWHDRAAGEAALDALDVLAEPGVPMRGRADMHAPAIVRRGAPSVRIAGLHFAHPGEAALFDAFDLHVAAGEHIALTGPSGAGKTALLSLIAGLLPAASGDIAIGGVSLNDATASTLRRRIGWMGQRPHVFVASVHDNVALGRTGVQRDDVTQAMRDAGLADVAQARPATALGEGGGGLSGGELVRLALARLAVQLEADLWLVDEPTAHLDADTAERVVDALLRLAQGKTLIAVTHDPILAARLQRVVRLGDAPALMAREAA